MFSAFQRMGGDAGGQGLGQAQGGQHDRDHERQGQQQVERGADKVGPEVADALAAIGDERSRQGRRHSRAGGRRNEVLHRQHQHLAERRHGGLARIALPIGVGDEADRRVERQVARKPREALRVQRQHALQAQHRIDEDKADQVEGQERQGVGVPALTLARINAAGLVEQALDGAHHRIEEGLLAVPDARKKDAQRPADGDR